VSNTETFKNITDTILDARFTEDELLRLNDFVITEIKEARRRDARRTIANLRVGGKAKVAKPLSGNAYLGEVGEVVKVNRTTVTMKFEKDHTAVRIPASVLEPADG